MASTIINVAVPDMSRVFALGQERAQWLSAGFMAAMTLSMLTTPWLLERYGYRHTYIGAVALLMVGGIGGGLCPWFDVVLAMRVAEGLAAGVLQPIPAIVILHAFGAGEHGKAMGIFGFGVVLAPAVGPSVGGILVEWWGWRSIFFVVAPFCASRSCHTALPAVGSPGSVTSAARRRFDGSASACRARRARVMNGMVQLHAARSTLGLALHRLRRVAARFIVRQRAAQAADGVRPVRASRLRMGGTVAFIYGMALFGSTYLVPVFMQWRSSFRLRKPARCCCRPGSCSPSHSVAGRLADQVAVSRMVRAGLVLLAPSFCVMLPVGVATTRGVIAVWAVVGRLGLGLILPSLNLGAVRRLPLATDLAGLQHHQFPAPARRRGRRGPGRQRPRASPAHACQRALARFHETFALLGAITALRRFVAAWAEGTDGGAEPGVGPRRKTGARRPMNLDLDQLPERCDVDRRRRRPGRLLACAQLLARAGRAVVLVDPACVSARQGLRRRPDPRRAPRARAPRRASTP